MKKILFFFSFLLSQLAMAQEFSIKRVELSEGLVNIYYDLLDSATDRSYTIKVFSSHDNYVSPLELVSGDAGLEIKPGSNHKVIWNATKELGSDFSGKIALEIRGRVYIPFIHLNGQYEVLKRAKPYEFTWTGGTEQNILNFDLMKDGKRVTTFSNIANVGHHPFVIPQDVKPGKGYTFRIVDSKNQDQIVYSYSFEVKRKVPLLVKVIPFAIAGAVVAILPKSKATDNSIPAAPGHP